jgi:hypothetical protein
MITAAQAMEQAIRYAIGDQHEVGRLWLDIARELREEAIQRRVWGAGSPETTADTRTLQEVREQRTEVLRTPVERPGDPIDAEATCVHCGYFIKVAVAIRTNADTAAKIYVHTRTGQRRCPVKTPAADETFIYTYAEPESSVRS